MRLKNKMIKNENNKDVYPIIDKYKYLGLLITDKMNIQIKIKMYNYNKFFLYFLFFFIFFTFFHF